MAIKPVQDAGLGRQRALSRLPHTLVGAGNRCSPRAGCGCARGVKGWGNHSPRDSAPYGSDTGCRALGCQPLVHPVSGTHVSLARTWLWGSLRSAAPDKQPR